MRKIVVLDGRTLGNVKFELLDQFGEVKYYSNTLKEETIERIKDAEIIITNKVVLDESNLKSAKNVKLICETGTGYNNIDVKYAAQNNIAVTNIGGYSTNTVAQHTFAMFLHLNNRISSFERFVKSGEYSKTSCYTNIDIPYEDIKGKVWGIVGLGAIGREVAKIAKCFGAEVIYYSTSGKNNNSNYERVNFEELLNRSDIISIHAPLNEHTEGMFNYNTICKMKKNSVLINVGRGPIVVDEDLARAINEDKIYGACLDVFVKEPMDSDNPLLHIKDKNRIVLTPHIAWASIQARNRLFDILIDNIKSFYEGGNKNRIC